MKKGIRNNNKGMTLVELLVAIAIFAAAIVPMLYAFVYSTGYNFRAQRVMQSTGIAQAVIERTKAANADITDIEAAIADCTIITKDGYFTADTPASGTSGNYTIYNVKTARGTGDAVDAGNSSRRAYDVVITYSEIPGNTTDLSSIQSMSSDRTANFTDVNASILRSEDMVAQGKIIEKIANEVIKDSNVYRVLGGAVPAGVNSSRFNSSNVITTRIPIDRKIIISASNSGVNVKVEYYCGGYDSNDDGLADSSDFYLTPVTVGGVQYGCKGNLSADYSMASGTPFYIADFDGSPDDGFDIFNSVASAVFFYYDPGYKAVSASQRTDGNESAWFHDYFVINNTMTTSATDEDGNVINRLDIYLFKQFRDGVYSNTGYNDVEWNYEPYIEMTSNALRTNLYHNFLVDVRDGSDLKTHSNPFAQNVSSHVTLHTALCFNRTDYDSYMLAHSDYSSRLRDTANQNVSHMLSDQNALPYMHEDLYVGGPISDLYKTRYEITVTVWPHGQIGVGSPIETMRSEFLNW